ncbi:hypothetical protein [Microbacterium sp. 22242]|uniref:hypothetical protein n=1 Tax=Microbacterium sp. 22242 TaxID=3453896 RepID=UPI003F84C72F
MVEFKNVERRTVLKGAAWSVPVIAVAAATPLASASVAPFNASVSAFCTNQYDVSALQALVPAPLVFTAVQTALNGLGIHAGATRGFTITATSGTTPAGTQYLLSDPNAILTLSGLQSLAIAGIAGIATVSGGFTFSLAAPLAQGSSLTLDFYRAIVNAGVASGLTLTQTTADANAGDNSATSSTLAAASVNLGSLGVLGASGSLTIQTCA